MPARVLICSRYGVYPLFRRNGQSVIAGRWSPLAGSSSLAQAAGTPALLRAPRRLNMALTG